jgi:hypothetical protein
MTGHDVRLEPYMRETPPGAFRALLWKEFRELLRPGLTALAIVGVGLLFTTSINRSDTTVGMYGASITTFSLFTLTSAVAGLIIGWTQIRREHRGDAWALLVHRPVRRSTIWWSKVVAGASVYLLAAGIPMVLAAAWNATPGHQPAPYDVRMMLPDVADLLCGVVYYVAALVATMREARWYASRALPIGAAMLCTTLVIAAQTFGMALLAIVVGAVVVGTAARAAFVAGGYYEPEPKAARAMLGVSVAIGLFIVGSMAIGIMSAMLTVNGPMSFRMTRLAVASDGSLVRVTTNFTPFSPDRPVQVVDLSGRPIGPLSTTGVAATAEIPLNVAGDYQRFAHADGYRGTGGIFVPLASYPPRQSETSWYYMKRLRLIAIYDNLSARRMGWLGPAGFTRGDAPPAQRFEGELRPYAEFAYFQPLITLPAAVYRIDRDARTIQQIFTARAGEEVLGAAGAGDSVAVTKLGPIGQFEAIATTRRLYVVSRDGAPELVVPHDPRAAGYGSVKVVRALDAPGTPTVVWYTAQDGTLPEAIRDTARAQITKYNAAGSAIAHLALRSDSTIGPPQRTEWARIVATRSVEPLMRPIWTAVRHSDARARPGAAHGGASPAVVGWIASLLGAIVWAIITYVIARRYALAPARRWWWTAVAFLGGTLGMLLMFSLLEWPAREPCPACGKERVVTRERCQHCGAPFTAPAPDGTEIFEAAPA